MIMKKKLKELKKWNSAKRNQETKKKPFNIPGRSPRWTFIINLGRRHPPLFTHDYPYPFSLLSLINPRRGNGIRGEYSVQQAGTAVRAARLAFAK